MTVTLRQESDARASTKGSALTFQELDNNFIDILNRAALTIEDQSSTQFTLGNDGTTTQELKVTGSGSITTALTQDSTGQTVLTISGTDSEGVKEIVAGTGISISEPDSAGARTITNTIADTGITDINGGTGITVDFDSARGATISTSALTDIVNDTTPQLGGTLDGQGNTVQNVLLENYTETIHNLTTDSAGSINIDIANGNVQEITLTENVTFTGFQNAATGQSVTLILKQDGTGTRTFTESLDSANSMVFAGGTSTLSTAGGSVDIMTILFAGGVYYASLSTNFS